MAYKLYNLKEVLYFVTYSNIISLLFAIDRNDLKFVVQVPMICTLLRQKIKGKASFFGKTATNYNLHLYNTYS